MWIMGPALLQSSMTDLHKLTSREAKDVHHRGTLPPGGDCLVAVEERDDNGGDAEQHSHSRERECCIDSVQGVVLINCRREKRGN